MRDADDVAGLFKVFGGDPAQYVKADAGRDAPQAGVGRWQLLSVIEDEMGTAAHTPAVAPAAEPSPHGSSPAVARDARQSPPWADMDEAGQQLPVLPLAAAAFSGDGEIGSVPEPARSTAIPSRVHAADGAGAGAGAIAEAAHAIGIDKAQAGGECSLSALYSRLARAPSDAPADPLKKLRFS